MSSIDTEELKLYKNDKLYNGSRYKVFQGNKSMEQFLGEPDYKKTVNYKSINEPILINQYIKECDEYTYGSITNQGKIYYFFVDDISTDAFQQTTIRYTIDWWSTNWNLINCTKANVKRQNKSKPNYMKQPYSPLYTYTRQEELSNDYCFMATYIPSSEKGTSYIATLILEGNDTNYKVINNGQWYAILDIPGADIKDCFAVPLFSYDEIKSNIEYNEVYLVSKKEGEGSTLLSAILGDFIDRFPTLVPFDSSSYYWCYCNETGNWYTIYYDSSEPLIPGIKANVVQGKISDSQHRFKETGYNEYYAEIDMTQTPIKTYRYIMENSAIKKSGSGQTSISDFPIIKINKDLTVNMETTEQIIQGISDWDGSYIWECPYGVSIKKFKVTLLKGLSHVLLQFIPYTDNSNYISNLISGQGFCYDCRHPGLFVDSYQDYIMKNRDYDIEMRRIQSEKQEIQAWASAVENVGFGKAFGKNIGAVAAGVGGIIESFSTYMINSTFDPQIQAQHDKLYARMTDQISLIGDSINNIPFESKLIKYDLIMDEGTIESMNEDIRINGYYSEEVTDNLNSYFYEHSIIQAENVVVEGACNVIGKQQIVRRLQNGVEFI